MGEENIQDRVKPWLMACFGEAVAYNKQERNFRFIEESLELVQSLNIEKEHVLKMVDYVFGRPKGEPFQEVGGVVITLSALCLANDLNMLEEGEKELARIWTKVDKIRAKQVTKEVIGMALTDLSSTNYFCQNPIFKKGDDLSRERAQIAFVEGSKISHKYFMPHEFVQLNKDKQMIDESGMVLNKTDFWLQRGTKPFNDGWFIKE